MYTLIKALRRALAEVSAVPGQEVARPNAAGSNWQYYVSESGGSGAKGSGIACDVVVEVSKIRHMFDLHLGG